MYLQTCKVGTYVQAVVQDVPSFFCGGGPELSLDSHSLLIVTEYKKN